MRIMGWVLAGMLALIGPWQPTPAADISVPPGDGTLAAAIAGASGGDTLLLGEGSYTGVATVNKSLAIRAESRAVHPVIAGGFSISGVGIRVTIQGLTFSSNLVPDQAAEIRLLQNQWVNVSLNAISYKTTEGDGSLMVIGNRFVNANLANVSSDDAYIAGNVVSGGSVITSSSAWIVGNDIYFTIPLSSEISVSLRRVTCRDFS
jgi:nitrous oxidase accessory protein NosD